MRILYIVPNPPSLVRVRPFNLIRALAERGHSVTVACPWRDATEWEDVVRLREAGFQVLTAPLTTPRIVRNCVHAVVRGLPLQATYGEVPELHRELEAHLEDRSNAYHVIHIEHLRGARYGLHVQRFLARRGGQATIPVIWDSVDCISHLFAQAAQQSQSRKGRWMARLELPRTRQYERRLLRLFDHVLVTSPVDREAFRDLAGAHWEALADRVTVLPNGVDLAYFHRVDTGRDAATVLFTGKMSYHANVTAALFLLQEIMPRVWEAIPHARVLIVGKDPPDRLRALAQAHPNVEVVGTVPDMRPYLHRATVAAAPVVYGAGIQNKVLEALACGLPVVTSETAARALAATWGEDLLVASDAATFAEQLVQVIRSPELQARLRRAGRAYVERHHSWQAIAHELEGVYERARSRPSPPQEAPLRFRTLSR